MKLKYNAPTTLTISLAAMVVFVVSYMFTGGKLAETWFMVPGRGAFDFHDPVQYVKLFSYVLGHKDWAHIFGNLSILLLIGPILEEGYGSVSMLVMTLITALVTGLLNVFFFPTSLYGASGIVFMMILLASFTNFGKGEIPITFILVMLLYLGQEVWNAIVARDNISHFAHIIGGFCGSLFGFFRPPKR